MIDLFDEPPTGFEWHDAKNESNIQKHGIDFRDAAKIFLRPHVRRQSNRGEEERYIAMGELHGEVVILVAFTPRGSNIRIISARKARHDERQLYYLQIHGF